MDERGFLTRAAYDVPTGAVTQRIDDVDTTQVSDAPPGWTTPVGGGLHLITDFLFDEEGRVTQALGPTHMQTTLYLVRHGATEANLARPPLLQGRGRDLPLARQGIRQAEATRAVLARDPIDLCFSSPLLRAVQTADILAAPHRLIPQPIDALTECDVGRWEGLDWQAIRERDPEAYQRFLADPALYGYAGGESYQDVWKRASAALEGLLTSYLGQTILVVAHHVVNRTYLAGLMGLPPSQARQIVLDNCAISTVVRRGKETRIHTLADTAHLRGFMHDNRPL